MDGLWDTEYEQAAFQPLKCDRPHVKCLAGPRVVFACSMYFSRVTFGCFFLLSWL